MGGLQKGYPGLTHTAKLVSEYIPPCETFVEPFAGLGRVSKYVNAKKYILNDMSDYSNNFCKENFPYAIVTKEDFLHCINKWDSESTLFFCDQPWSRIDYVKNEKTYCDRGVGEYYKQLLDVLKNCKSRWIVAGRASGGARSTVSVYFKCFEMITIEGNKKINGYNVKVKLASNFKLVKDNKNVL